MQEQNHQLMQAAAVLVAPALTDTGLARRLMGQAAQPGARAPEVWELFDHVLAQLRQRQPGLAQTVSTDAVAGPGPGRELYKSSNGDRWLLHSEANTGATYIIHAPNRASGGDVSRSSPAAFLAAGNGPEQQALLSLIADAAHSDAAR
jgi:hypothetical protein